MIRAAKQSEQAADLQNVTILGSSEDNQTSFADEADLAALSFIDIEEVPANPFGAKA